MPRPLRILIPVWAFGKAGGYRVLSQMANNWIKSGHHVDFLVSEFSDLPYFPTKANIIWINNFGQEKYKNNAKRPKRAGLRMFLALFPGMIRQSAKYDVIIANQSLTAWPVWVFGRSQKKVYFIQAYEPEFYLMQRSIKSIPAYLLSLSSYYLPLLKISNSPSYVNDKKVRAENYVPPGIDLKIFSPKENVKRQKSFKESEIVIGCIGRKEPSKGISLLLEAFDQLGPEYCLRVAYGDMPEFEMEKAYKVVFPTNDKELSEFYKSIDILVTPGIVQHGSYHYPVMEALACGTPVVHTGYRPGTKENSWICEPRSVDSIVNTIRGIDLTERRTEAKVQQGIADVKKYSWEEVSKKFLSLIFES